ncbi:hypothetical protein [Brevibacterium album]|uniref:hypothetical protein n=1 Tax=Brevibacterium album TaxID=417948 RepID=UPI0003FEE8F1|nr:hypothetical protein [Brevibacterium album]
MASNERLAQIGAESAKSFPPDRRPERLAFALGALWADANPQLRTITRARLLQLQDEADYWTRRGNPMNVGALLASIGIEVTD